MKIAWLFFISTIVATSSYAGPIQCLEKLAEPAAKALIVSTKRTPDGLIVIVDEKAWTLIGFRSKQLLVTAMGCAFLGSDDQLGSIVLRSQRTNDVVGWQVLGRLTVPLMFQR